MNFFFQAAPQHSSHNAQEDIEAAQPHSDPCSGDYRRYESRRKKVFFYIISFYSIDRVADLHHFSADPDTAFHFNANPDPAPLKSDGNQRSLVYRTSSAQF
jgi:hypothetical protein